MARVAKHSAYSVLLGFMVLLHIAETDSVYYLNVCIFTFRLGSTVNSARLLLSFQYLYLLCLYPKLQNVMLAHSG